jgi:thymidylate kinase
MATQTLPVLDALNAPIAYALRAALDRHHVSYCQWRGQKTLERWVRGEGDLDLLVARRDLGRLATALAEVGFKRAVSPPGKDVPGVMSYYCYDAERRAFLHLHVHVQLRLGEHWTMNYHVPLEAAVLASSGPGPILRVPAPELEFIIFVIRMVLSQSVRASISQRPGLTRKRAAEWEYFASRVSQARVSECLRAHLPWLSSSVFDKWVRSLSPSCPLITRIRARRQVCRYLRTHRSATADVARRLRYAGRERYRRLAGKAPRRSHMATGGLMVAVLGGDGAGKTTAVNELTGWLSRSFDVMTVHLGKPPRSLATLGIAVLRRLIPNWLFRATGMPNLVLLLRSVSIARDRHRLYARASRMATDGTIVICDRYPTRFIRHMDGPNIRVDAVRPAFRWIVGVLQRYERAYYDRILPPDVAILLRVHPEVAAARKVDEDPEYVRIRSREVWDIDLTDSVARVIDANQPQPKVLADLRSLLWSYL